MHSFGNNFGLLVTNLKATWLHGVGGRKLSFVTYCKCTDGYLKKMFRVTVFTEIRVSAPNLVEESWSELKWTKDLSKLWAVNTECYLIILTRSAENFWMVKVNVFFLQVYWAHTQNALTKAISSM